jgi:glycosyltransferase involved in cell wall biosynthesis
VRVLVLTTSYPRSEDEVAGIFVADAVAALREAGVEVSVVSPADFRHFGIAYGDGIVQNLRAKPWLWFAVPLFLLGFARAARRASREVDVVHAHWIPSALPALATGKPFVLQVWGTDVELARRARWLARPLVRRARVVIAASSYLADAARGLGAREVRVIPPGVKIPAEVGEPDDPPHVLFVGRLSEEKGILDFAAATEGLPRVIVGDGPLRGRVPETLGFVPPAELGSHYERAAVVCVPSRREGYGVVAREAMAYGRPVVATRAGGLIDAVEDGVTGFLVDSASLRGAIETLLGDPGLRRRLGVAARESAFRSYAWPSVVEATIGAYA